MASWTSMGHAMRRRMGAPSNHLEAAGKSMTRNHMTPEEIIASAEHANSARRYMGQNSMGVEAVSPERGTPMPRKNTQSADPTAGGKTNRVNVSAGNAAQSERAGAKYRLTASFPTVDPAAGPTMANAKIIPSVMGQSANFVGGESSSY